VRAGKRPAGGFPPATGHKHREIERSTALFLIVDRSAPVGRRLIFRCGRHGTARCWVASSFVQSAREHERTASEF